MYCPHCGKETAEGYNHCFRCGKDTVVFENSETGKKKTNSTKAMSLILATLLVTTGIFAYLWYRSSGDLDNLNQTSDQQTSDLNNQISGLNNQISDLNQQISSLKQQIDSYRAITVIEISDYPGYIIATSPFPSP